ncbi:putative membrane protein [Dysgonomonas sp. PH5-45]|nr:putative membrane protein [Dysgonomonas sp. PH5-45]MDH6388084.1 putative membrane protein [Dysgonomonas sp. PH5-37]
MPIKTKNKKLQPKAKIRIILGVYAIVAVAILVLIFNII